MACCIKNSLFYIHKLFVCFIGIVRYSNIKSTIKRGMAHVPKYSPEVNVTPLKES